MLPDWQALIVRMNLSPVIVKVRPAWRRLGYRLSRHPLPVPAIPLPRSPWLPVPDPELAAAESAAPVPAAMNGHGGRPGELVKGKP